MAPMRVQKLELEAPHEPPSQSGAKDARTPNAAASSGRPAPARSVWSACVFSAALPPTFSQSAVQGFKARIVSGNSLPARNERGESRREGHSEPTNLLSMNLPPK